MPTQAQQRPSRDRIRACSISLSSGSQLVGNLQWSELGQALVVTDEYLVVLSPLVGLHPTLAGQSRSQDVECHPDWQGRFPHTVNQINVKTFLENEQAIRSRTILESDHSAVDARFVNAQWTSASWSKPDLGPHGSCLVLATTSELDLFILGAPQNAWIGEWKLLHSVDLGPLVDLIEVDESLGDLDHLRQSGDKDGFTRGRALLRKKQLAAEVLCAAFVDPSPAMGDRVGSSENSASPRSTSAYIVAGTRSGHIAVFKYEARAGHCTFVTACAASNTSIEKLVATTQFEAQAKGAHARIAFQDATGVATCDLYTLGDRCNLQPSAAPPVLEQPLMVSAWRWCRHQLVLATVGQVQVCDSWTGRRTVFELATDPDSTDDPYALAICIDERSDPPSSVEVVLQDLRRYRIPLKHRATPKSAQQHISLSATYPAALSGYPPLIEKLQRRHDQHQIFLAYQTDTSSDIMDAALVGAIRTDERIAFLGYNVSETLRYQLELSRESHVIPADLLERALVRLHHLDGAKTSPYLVIRAVLALLFTSGQPDQFRGELISAVEARWRLLLDAPSTAASQTPESEATRRTQLSALFILACRLQTQDQDETALESLMKRHKAEVLCNWLCRWLQELTQKTVGSQTSSEDRKLLRRLITAGQSVPHPGPQLSEACREATSAMNLPAKGSGSEARDGGTAGGLTEESCVACETQLTIAWNDDQQDFGWATCRKGHVWPRCSVSLATISDREVRVCTACWAKSLSPDQSIQSSWQTLMLEEATRCLYCGSCWILR